MSIVDELSEDEQAFLHALVEAVREDVGKSDDLREEHDADAFTRSLLLEGFPLVQNGIDRIAKDIEPGVDLPTLLESLEEKKAVELAEMQEKTFIRINESVVDQLLLDT